MDNRSFESAASATPPSAPASPSSGYPTNGNPSLAIPATLPGDYWFHQVGEEIRAAIVAGGLTPSAGTLNQLASAIFGPKSLAPTGYITLPGGLIIQWGSLSSVPGNGSAVFTYPIAFPSMRSAAACLVNAPSDSSATFESVTALVSDRFYNWSGVARNLFILAVGY